MGFELHRLPASAFGISLGTAGQAGLWSALKLHNETTGPLSFLSNAPIHGLSTAFWILTLGALCLTTLSYVLKAVLRWRSVVWEFRSSIHINFFFMPFLVLLVLGVTAPVPPFPSAKFSLVLLYVVVVLMLALEIYVYTEWMYGVSRSLAWANPTYQLSIVGNIIGAGVAAQLGDSTLAMFLFSIGMLYLLLTLTALHTVRDARSWLGMAAGASRPPAVGTVHAGWSQDWANGAARRSSRAQRRASLFSACDGDGDLSPTHVEVRATGLDAGTVVFNNRLESPELDGVGNVQAADLPDQACTRPILSSPADQQHSDDDSNDFTAELEKAVDLLTVGEVHTKQFNPLSMNTWSLPDALHPTLFLYVAPPSLSALAWLHIQGGKVGAGHCDQLCQGFASISIFFFFFMLANLPRFLLRSPFSLAFWAFTFPMSALAVSTSEFALASGSIFLQGFSAFLIILSSFVYVAVALATIIHPILNGVDTLLLPRRVPR